jgi:hypothetical protein
MSEAAKKVKCPECGIEAQVDIRNRTMRSFEIGKDELQRKCKHLGHSQPNFICPSLQPELAKLVDSMRPSGSRQ